MHSTGSELLLACDAALITMQPRMTGVLQACAIRQLYMVAYGRAARLISVRSTGAVVGTERESVPICRALCFVRVLTLCCPGTVQLESD